MHALPHDCVLSASPHAASKGPSLQLRTLPVVFTRSLPDTCKYIPILNWFSVQSVQENAKKPNPASDRVFDFGLFFCSKSRSGCGKAASYSLWKVHVSTCLFWPLFTGFFGKKSVRLSTRLFCLQVCAVLIKRQKQTGGEWCVYGSRAWRGTLNARPGEGGRENNSRQQTTEGCLSNGRLWHFSGRPDLPATSCTNNSGLVEQIIPKKSNNLQIIRELFVNCLFLLFSWFLFFGALKAVRRRAAQGME